MGRAIGPEDTMIEDCRFSDGSGLGIFWDTCLIQA